MRLVIKEYWQAIRSERLRGAGWLFWPALWALWIANHGWPSFGKALLFVGIALLAYLGIYILNDLHLYRFKKPVLQARNTPLNKQQVTTQEAQILFFIIFLCALFLATLINGLAMSLISIGFFLGLIYEWTKEFSYKTGIFLILLSLWSVLIVFSLKSFHLSPIAYLLGGIVFLWLMLYEIMHALVESGSRKKKSAISLFENARLVIAILQILMGGLLIILGIFGGLNVMYFISLLFVAGIFIYQQRLIQQHQIDHYRVACLHNKHIGLIIFLGILFSYII